MRTFIGGLVFIAGVGGLSVWGANSHADRMETQIRGDAQLIGDTGLHTVDVTVAGRDIAVTGIADTAQERDRIVAALNQIEGRRVVRDDLQILPVAEPYSFAVTRKDGRSFMQGNVPSEEMRLALDGSGAEGAAGLTLASGAPDRWEAAVGSGLATLSQMEEGAVSAEGTTVRLSGLVDTPSDRDALLASMTLPDGFELVSDIETRDDGKPVDFTVAYSAATGADVTGKLPAGLDLAGIGGALGLADVSGDAAAGEPGTPDASLEAMRGISAWLPEFDTAALRFTEGGASVTGQVTPGADPSLIASAMQRDLGDGVQIRLSELQTEPQAGATRINVATGEAEQFTNGYWLPNFTFSPTLASCTAQTEQVLARAKINFLSGSTQLGPRSIRAINAVASVVRRCVNDAGLSAEIGGHTDNTGSGNFQLSADRAVAVQAAMIERGVARDAINALGFGASKPIADNATEEGRAANRRTTITWTR